MTKKTRIVIVDDHPIVRSGLGRAIDEDPAFEVIAAAGDGEAGLALIEELRPDIAVLDIEMPKLGGLDVARQVAVLGLPTKIVFLTLHKDEDFFREAIKAGGKGYLLKDSAMEDIVAGLHAVMANKLYMSAGVAASLTDRRRTPRRVPPTQMTAVLTNTERQILKLIVSGKSSKEIGSDLAIHYRTVENHRTNMCRKFGVEGANALLRFALQHRELLS